MASRGRSIGLKHGCLVSGIAVVALTLSACNVPGLTQSAPDEAVGQATSDRWVGWTSPIPYEHPGVEAVSRPVFSLRDEPAETPVEEPVAEKEPAFVAQPSNTSEAEGEADKEPVLATVPAEQPIEEQVLKPVASILVPDAPNKLVDVIGLSQNETLVLLGMPVAQWDVPPAKVWRYEAVNCAVDVYFYLDVSHNQFHALQYASTEKTIPVTVLQKCLQKVRDGRKR